MTVSLLSTGFIAILGQVALLRELNVAFYGVELVYLFSLGLWLLWTAAGALIGRRVHFPSLTRIAVLFVLFGIALPADIAFIRAGRLLFGGVPGAYLAFLEQMAVVVVSTLPLGLLSGLLFQWSAKRYVTEDGTLAVAYAVESAGGLIGGLLSTLFLAGGIRNGSAALACALASILTSLFLLKDQRKSPLWRAAIALACILTALLWKASIPDRWMTGWNHPNLLESRDTPYGRITVTRLHGQVAVFENDALAFETEGTEAEHFCHLAALQHPNPKDVLILGGGMEGIVREIGKHRPRRIDYVEMNPVMLTLVTPHLPGGIQKSLEEPSVHIVFADPRRYLRESGAYDLILIGMPEPASGQTNRFYTREFFRQCSAKLNPGGILGLRLQTAENLWTLPLVRRNAGIYKSLRSVFPEVLFLPGTTNVVTASQDPLPHTPEILSRRLRELKMETRLVSPQYIEYLFANDRYLEIRSLLEREKAIFNTDTRPVCYQYAFIIWLSKFFPDMALVDPALAVERHFSKPSLSRLWWVGLLVLFLLSRFRPAVRRTLLVAAAGFLGMVLETILILYYQVKHGVLYQDIGLLLMSFMAGLAAGAAIVNRLMVRPAGGGQSSRWCGFGLLSGFCLLCWHLQAEIAMSLSIGLVHTSLLLLAAGALVAGIFADAGLREVKDHENVISTLYAADLVGGCLGSLLGSLILIPLAGMDVTAQAMLLFAALSLVLA